MSTNNLLTLFKKVSLSFIIIFTVFTLSGCAMNLDPIDSQATGIFDHYFIYPFSLLIKMVANWFHGHYGVAIILITIVIRFILMPFFVKQSVNSQESQRKIKLMKPEMDDIQAKYKGKSNQKDQLQLQKELGELYRKYDFHPFKMMAGCLPLLLQMPFLIGFYYAIRRTPEIAEQSFLWFNLGETDILFVLIAMAIYFVQARVGLIGLEEAQRKQMMLFSYMSPIMIGIISFTLPAALPLYWAVSGLFVIIQTLIIKKIVLQRKQNELVI